MALALILLTVLPAVSVGTAGFRAGVSGALNLIGLGFAAAVGSACVVSWQGGPRLVG